MDTKWRAFWWGLLHPFGPFATQEQHLRWAQRAALEQEKRNPSEDDEEEVAWKLLRYLDGWTCWQYHPPPRALIQVWRFEWSEPLLMNAWDINPVENVVGLYWRLTGIEKEARDGTLGS
jgi:hypothetical protein